MLIKRRFLNTKLKIGNCGLMAVSVIIGGALFTMP